MTDQDWDEEKDLEFDSRLHVHTSLPRRLLHYSSHLIHSFRPVKTARYHRLPSPSRRAFRVSWKRRLLSLLALISSFILLLVVLTGIFFPSYTRAPAHYNQIRKQTVASAIAGRANVNGEKVYIAASIYDESGKLVSGAWGDALLRLVDLLGPDNVFLSIYENDVDDESRAQLDLFRPRIACNSSLIAEHLETRNLPHVTVPSGAQVLKRIGFLAEVRNRALKPLDDPTSPAFDTKFDKLLYINDVIFDPVDAANLLFSTNVDENGKAQYTAACSADFINPFKYYDTFATRDLDGYSLGIPFFPWFPNSGHAVSRKDVVAQKDAVRVRSCWGGMIAYDAQPFQRDMSVQTTPSAIATEVTATSTGKDANLNWNLATSYPGSGKLAARSEVQEHRPVRFRATSDTFWEASECCLINADLQGPRGDDPYESTGIYLNPYIRVAYDTKTLSWLAFTRRFERLYAPIHRILNWWTGMPGVNPRRTEEPGQLVVDRVWVQDYEQGNVTATPGVGEWQNVQRMAQPGGFCGSRMLLGLPDDESGESWTHINAPEDDQDPTGKGFAAMNRDGTPII